MISFSFSISFVLFHFKKNAWVESATRIHSVYMCSKVCSYTSTMQTDQRGVKVENNTLF